MKIFDFYYVVYLTRDQEWQECLDVLWLGMMEELTGHLNGACNNL